MPGDRRMSRTAAALAAALSLPLPSAAYVVTITAGTRSLYLQVGTGTGSGFSTGGTPGNNATVNQVTVTIPPSSLGTGTLPMTTDSTTTTSPYDGAASCPVTNPPLWVFIGGFYRAPGGTGSQDAILTVTSPAALVSGADAIPFDSISWTSTSTRGAPNVAPGTFPATGGTTTLFSLTRNGWFESCMQFSYANTAVVPPGTYTNRVTYTLTAP